MKISMMSVVVLLVVAHAAPVTAQTGDLKVRFQYGGKAPAVSGLVINKDVEFCGKDTVLNERLLVNPDNQGVKNVILYVYTGRGGSKLDPVAPVNQTHELANNKCRFEPHVVIAQKGDTLKVTNPDAVGHNANLVFINNVQQNFTVAPGQEKLVELTEAEPAPMPVECNIHPWMKAWVVVFDHPYVAASDENGELLIKGIPVGKQTFRVNHEAGSIRQVSIGGKDEEWKSSRVELDIKPGLNDLGTVIIPADALTVE